MNKQIRIMAERTRTLNKIIQTCERGISIINEGVSMSSLDELSGIYSDVSSVSGLEKMGKGLKGIHAEQIRQNIETAKNAKESFEGKTISTAESCRLEFKSLYEILVCSNSPSKEDLNGLDKKAKLSAGIESVVKPYKGFFSGLFKKSEANNYIDARNRLEVLEKRVDASIKEYMSKDITSRRQAKKILATFERLSSEKKKAMSNNPLLEKVYFGSELQAIEDLKLITQNFRDYSNQEKGIKDYTKRLKVKIKQISEAKNKKPEIALAELNLIESEEHPVYHLGRTLRFSVLKSESSRLFDESKKAAGEMKMEVISSVIKGINENYAFVENAVREGFSSEKYEVDVAVAKEKLAKAKDDINILRPFYNTKDHMQEYKELSAAVDTAISAFEEHKEERQTSARIREKDLDYKSEHLRKAEKIRQMELEAAELTRRRESRHYVSSTQTSSHPSASAEDFPVQDDSFCNLALYVRGIGFPDNPSLLELPGIVQDRNKPWEDKLKRARNAVVMLNGLSSKNDIQYLEKFRDGISASIENGTLTAEVEKSAGVKEAAEMVVYVLDSYVQSCKNLELVS